MSGFDLGILHCEHQDQDMISIKSKGVILLVTSRCLECGAVQNEKGGWWPMPCIVLQLLCDGEDEFAQQWIDLMDNGRRQLKIPYPIHTIEEYKMEAEKIKPELDKIRKSKLN